MRFLRAEGIDYRVHDFAHDGRADNFGAEAVDGLDHPAERVFKTLMLDVDGRLAMALIPVIGRLDLKACAKALGSKRAALAEPARVERRTGYAVGGISPLGQRNRCPAVVDASALNGSSCQGDTTGSAADSILVSAGRRGSDIELDPHQLIRITGAVVASITAA